MYKKGGPNFGRKKGVPNKSTDTVKAMLAELLPDAMTKEIWQKWLNFKDDPKIAFEAFKIALAYKYGKPVQPIINEEDLPPVRIDISAIPLRRERVN